MIGTSLEFSRTFFYNAFKLMSDLIAIVGRPNVGKSALFNRIVGKRIAIVHDQPGVTRDRISAEAEWHGRPFSLVDTGGIGLLKGEKTDDPIVKAALVQVQIAIEEAQVILFVVDGKEGLVPLDNEVANRLRASGKTILLAVNKVDDDRERNNASEFTALGFGRVYDISAIHGRGIDGLMKGLLDSLPKREARSKTEPGASIEPMALKLAIAGRPNVGKSSLINSLTSSDRVIVSPIAGTTRDSVDVPFTVTTEGRQEHYVLIDTAGLRKRRSVGESIEFFSVKRAEDSVKRSDIVIFVLDAEAGILMQDKKIADLIVEERKPCIVVINKWDLVAGAVAEARAAAEKKKAKVEFNRDRPHAPPNTLAEFAGWVQEKLFFLDYAPVIFTSAKEGFNLDRLLEAVRFVSAQMLQKVPTGLLNRTLREAIERRGPISSRGHLLNFFYATQVQTTPPKFLLFVNNEDLFSPSYEKYLSGELRKSFGFEGCPIILEAKSRTKTVASKRDRQSKKSQPAHSGKANRMPAGFKRSGKPQKGGASSNRFKTPGNEPR